MNRVFNYGSFMLGTGWEAYWRLSKDDGFLVAVRVGFPGWPGGEWFKAVTDDFGTLVPVQSTPA